MVSNSFYLCINKKYSVKDVIEEISDSIYMELECNAYIIGIDMVMRPLTPIENKFMLREFNLSNMSGIIINQTNDLNHDLFDKIDISDRIDTLFINGEYDDFDYNLFDLTDDINKRFSRYNKLIIINNNIKENKYEKRRFKG